MGQHSFLGVIHLDCGHDNTGHAALLHIIFPLTHSHITHGSLEVLGIWSPSL
jgi:hypothetical protein